MFRGWSDTRFRGEYLSLVDAQIIFHLGDEGVADSPWVYAGRVWAYCESDMFWDDHFQWLFVPGVDLRTERRPALVDPEVEAVMDRPLRNGDIIRTNTRGRPSPNLTWVVGDVGRKLNVHTLQPLDRGTR